MLLRQRKDDRGLSRLAWVCRRRVLSSILVVAMCGMSMAVSASSEIETATAVVDWSGFLSPQMVFSYAVMLVHFGGILQERRETRDRLAKLELWQSNSTNLFTAREVIEVELKAIGHRLESIEKKL